MEKKNKEQFFLDCVKEANEIINSMPEEWYQKTTKYIFLREKIFQYYFNLEKEDKKKTKEIIVNIQKN